MVAGAFASQALAQSDHPCSTERVNGNCVVTIDRNYPITLPTIQMRKNATVTVNVVNPLPFEQLSLDFQSSQALAGSDQAASLLSSMLSSIKAIATPIAAHLAPSGFNPGGNQIDDDIEKLNKMSQLDISQFLSDSELVYTQLQEALSPIPRPRQPDGTIVRPEKLANTKDPWSAFGEWRALLLCELAGVECQNKNPQVKNLILTAATLQYATAGTSASTVCDPKTIQAFYILAATVDAEIRKAPSQAQDAYRTQLAQAEGDEAAAASFCTALPQISKDFQNYVQSIQETNPTPAPETAGQQKKAPPPLGLIHDPRENSAANSTSTKALGPQVTFAVNAVNEISAAATSVPSSSQKNAIATITVLYADPIFEMSAGALFSTLPDRTFANQTQVTQIAGVPTPENVVISQSMIRPIVLPFVAANWRLGHDFLMPDKHRGAVYFTAGVGFNAYNTTAEYVAGPSISWRSIMISPLLHMGHDVRLTQGETVGEIWCNSQAMSTSTPPVPKCSGNPPAPSTQTHWVPAFALGISVRIPSVFGSGSSGGSGGKSGH